MHGYGIGAPATPVPREYNLITLAFMGAAMAAISIPTAISLWNEAARVEKKPYTDADKVMWLSPAEQTRARSGIVAVFAAGGATLTIGSLIALRRRPENEVASAPSGPTPPSQD